MLKHLSFGVLFLITISSFAQKTIGIHLSYIDSSVSPRQDFYQFTNGKWLKDTKIPESESSWGSFHEIDKQNNENLKSLFNSLVKEKTITPNSNKQKLKDFYETAIDSVKANKNGIKPIVGDLAAIEAIKTTDDLVKTAALFNKKGISSILSFFIESDLKNSNSNAAYLSQTGLGLPDKDYYFEDRYESIRTDYVLHIQRMFQLLKVKPEIAKARAELVFSIEKALAKNSMNALEQRDMQAQYNLYSKPELISLSPNINWNVFFSALNITMPEQIIINQVNYYKELNNLLFSFSINDWKWFLKWKLLRTSATYLSNEFVTENFSFNGKTLSGAKQMRPRWRRAIDVTDKNIGEILGQLYVEKYFDASAKARVNKMVDDLIASYRERINSRDWMSDTTKKQAHLKLDKLIRKLGFPDKWTDYSKLTITRNSYWKNITACNEFAYKKMLNKIGKPVDRTEWGMTPPTVNAYYNPTSNEIAFPAGIMQPPFFDVNADDAFNYGIMGAVIGHELTHGFDDQGSQFDANGDLKMWWTDEDFKKFKEKTKLIIEQFNGYVAVDTLRVNGELTQGENIADLGGLTMAYYAYKKTLNGKKSDIVSGFTGEQRFFIAWAQGWKGLRRTEALKQLIATNPHSPEKFRGNGPLSNMPEFYEAFNVKEGDAMWRPVNKRVSIW